MMRRSLLALLLLLPLGATTDCGIESVVPVGEPDTAERDGRLLGAWSCTHDDDPEHGPVRIYAFGEREYYVRVGRPDEEEHFRAFAAELHGRRFLNLQGLRFEPSRGYIILGYDIDASGGLTAGIVEVGTGEAKPRTREALAVLVAKALADGTLFDADDRYACERSG